MSIKWPYSPMAWQVRHQRNDAALANLATHAMRSAMIGGLLSCRLHSLRSNHRPPSTVMAPIASQICVGSRGCSAMLGAERRRQRPGVLHRPVGGAEGGERRQPCRSARQNGRSVFAIAQTPRRRRRCCCPICHECCHRPTLHHLRCRRCCCWSCHECCRRRCLDCMHCRRCWCLLAGHYCVHQHLGDDMQVEWTRLHHHFSSELQDSPLGNTKEMTSHNQRGEIPVEWTGLHHLFSVG